MKKVLHIIASPREENSRTLKISRALLDSLKLQTAIELDELNVFSEALPEMNVTRVGGKYMLMNGEELAGDAEKSWHEIIAHIDRLKSADIVIVSTPMWNFSLPYRLKHYIDIVAQPGFTFRYGANGPEGMLTGKKLFVVTSHGGDYGPDSSFAAYDKLRPYLEQVFAFLGMTDQTFITAQPMDAGGAEVRTQKLQAAVEQAKKIVI